MGIRKKLINHKNTKKPDISEFLNTNYKTKKQKQIYHRENHKTGYIGQTGGAGEYTTREKIFGKTYTEIPEGFYIVKNKKEYAQLARDVRNTWIRLAIQRKFGRMREQEYLMFKALLRANLYFARFNLYFEKLTNLTIILNHGNASLIQELRHSMDLIFSYQKDIQNEISLKINKKGINPKDIEKKVKKQDKERQKIFNAFLFKKSYDFMEGCDNPLGLSGTKKLLCILNKYRKVEGKFNKYFGKFRDEIKDFFTAYQGCHGKSKAIDLQLLDISGFEGINQTEKFINEQTCEHFKANEQKDKILSKALSDDIASDVVAKEKQERVSTRFKDQVNSLESMMKAFNQKIKDINERFVIMEYYGLHRYPGLKPQKKRILQSILGEKGYQVINPKRLAKLSMDPDFIKQFEDVIKDIADRGKDLLLPIDKSIGNLIPIIRLNSSKITLIQPQKSLPGAQPDIELTFLSMNMDNFQWENFNMNKLFDSASAPAPSPSPLPALAPAPAIAPAPAPAPAPAIAPAPAKAPSPAPAKASASVLRPAPTLASTPTPTLASTPAPATAPAPAPTLAYTPAPTPTKAPAPATTPTKAPTPAPTPTKTSAPTKASAPAIDINDLDKKKLTYEQVKGLKLKQRLELFKVAQSKCMYGATFKTALEEILNCNKKNHWMWYIIPSQLPDNNDDKYSDNSKIFSINNPHYSPITVNDYLSDDDDGFPMLRLNYQSIIKAINDCINQGKKISGIFTNPDDIPKLKSSINIFLEEYKKIYNAKKYPDIKTFIGVLENVQKNIPHTLTGGAVVPPPTPDTNPAIICIQNGSQGMTQKTGSFTTGFLLGKYTPVSYSSHRNNKYNIIFVRTDLIMEDPSKPDYIKNLQPVNQSGRFVLNKFPDGMTWENNGRSYTAVNIGFDDIINKGVCVVCTELVGSRPDDMFFANKIRDFEYKLLDGTPQKGLRGAQITSILEIIKSINGTLPDFIVGDMGGMYETSKLPTKIFKLGNEIIPGGKTYQAAAWEFFKKKYPDLVQYFLTNPITGEGNINSYLSNGFDTALANYFPSTIEPYIGGKNITKLEPPLVSSYIFSSSSHSVNSYSAQSQIDKIAELGGNIPIHVSCIIHKNDLSDLSKAMQGTGIAAKKDKPVILFTQERLQKIQQIVDNLMANFAFGSSPYLRRDLGCLSLRENSLFSNRDLPKLYDKKLFGKGKSLLKIPIHKIKFSHLEDVANYSENEEGINQLKDLYCQELPSILDTYLFQVSGKFAKTAGTNEFYSFNQTTSSSSRVDKLNFPSKLKILSDAENATQLEDKLLTPDIAVRLFIMPRRHLKLVMGIDLEKHGASNLRKLTTLALQNFYATYAINRLEGRLSEILTSRTTPGVDTKSISSSPSYNILSHLLEKTADGHLSNLNDGNAVLDLFEIIFIFLRLKFIDHQIHLYNIKTKEQQTEQAKLEKTVISSIDGKSTSSNLFNTFKELLSSDNPLNKILNNVKITRIDSQTGKYLLEPKTEKEENSVFNIIAKGYSTKQNVEPKPIAELMKQKLLGLQYMESFLSHQLGLRLQIIANMLEKQNITPDAEKPFKTNLAEGVLGIEPKEYELDTLEEKILILHRETQVAEPKEVAMANDILARCKTIIENLRNIDGLLKYFYNIVSLLQYYNQSIKLLILYENNDENPPHFTKQDIIEQINLILNNALKKFEIVKKYAFNLSRDIELIVEYIKKIKEYIENPNVKNELAFSFLSSNELQQDSFTSKLQAHYQPDLYDIQLQTSYLVFNNIISLVYSGKQENIFTAPIPAPTPAIKTIPPLTTIPAPVSKIISPSKLLTPSKPKTIPGVSSSKHTSAPAPASASTPLKASASPSVSGTAPTSALAPLKASAPSYKIFNLNIDSLSDYIKYKIDSNYKTGETKNKTFSDVFNELNPDEKTKNEFAQSTYPIIHADVLNFITTTFVNWFNSNYKAIKIKEENYIDRLFEKRPLTFYKENDTTVCRIMDTEDCKKDTTDFTVPTENYISYDEMPVSALLGLSGPVHFINGSGKTNKCKRDFNPAVVGYLYGLVGARFARPELMEWKHIIITKEQNTTDNGYGLNPLKSNENLNMWAKLYGVEHFPTYEEAKEQSKTDKTKYVVFKNIDISPQEMYFNIEIYKKRMKFSLLPFLMDVNERCKILKKVNARCFVSGLGLGEWKTIDEQEQYFYEAFFELLRDNKFEHIKTFATYTEIPKDERKVFFNNIIIKVKGTSNEKTEPNITTFTITVNGITYKFQAGKINPVEQNPTDNGENLVNFVSYAWDSNSYPGNEFYNGKLAGSMDSATMCSCDALYYHNIIANRNITQTNIRVYGSTVSATSSAPLKAPAATTKASAKTPALTINIPDTCKQTFSNELKTEINKTKLPTMDKDLNQMFKEDVIKQTILAINLVMESLIRNPKITYKTDEQNNIGKVKNSPYLNSKSDELLLEILKIVKRYLSLGDGQLSFYNELEDILRNSGQYIRNVASSITQIFGTMSGGAITLEIDSINYQELQYFCDLLEIGYYNFNHHHQNTQKGGGHVELLRTNFDILVKTSRYIWIASNILAKKEESYDFITKNINNTIELSKLFKEILTSITAFDNLISKTSSNKALCGYILKPLGLLCDFAYHITNTFTSTTAITATTATTNPIFSNNALITSPSTATPTNPLSAFNELYRKLKNTIQKGNEIDAINTAHSLKGLEISAIFKQISGNLGMVDSLKMDYGEIGNATMEALIGLSKYEEYVHHNEIMQLITDKITDGISKAESIYNQFKMNNLKNMQELDEKCSENIRNLQANDYCDTKDMPETLANEAQIKYKPSIFNLNVAKQINENIYDNNMDNTENSMLYLFLDVIDYCKKNTDTVSALYKTIIDEKFSENPGSLFNELNENPNNTNIIPFSSVYEMSRIIDDAMGSPSSNSQNHLKFNDRLNEIFSLPQFNLNTDVPDYIARGKNTNTYGELANDFNFGDERPYNNLLFLLYNLLYLKRFTITQKINIIPCLPDEGFLSLLYHNLFNRDETRLTDGKKFCINYFNGDEIDFNENMFIDLNFLRRYFLKVIYENNKLKNTSGECLDKETRIQLILTSIFTLSYLLNHNPTQPTHEEIQAFAYMILGVSVLKNYTPSLYFKIGAIINIPINDEFTWIDRFISYFLKNKVSYYFPKITDNTIAINNDTVIAYLKSLCVCKSNLFAKDIYTDVSNKNNFMNVLGFINTARATSNNELNELFKKQYLFRRLEILLGTKNKGLLHDYQEKYNLDLNVANSEKGLPHKYFLLDYINSIGLKSIIENLDSSSSLSSSLSINIDCCNSNYINDDSDDDLNKFIDEYKNICDKLRDSIMENFINQMLKCFQIDKDITLESLLLIIDRIKDETKTNDPLFYFIKLFYSILDCVAFVLNYYIPRQDELDKFDELFLTNSKYQDKMINIFNMILDIFKNELNTLLQPFFSFKLEKVNKDEEELIILNKSILDNIKNNLEEFQKVSVNGKIPDYDIISRTSSISNLLNLPLNTDLEVFDFINRLITCYDNDNNYYGIGNTSILEKYLSNPEVLTFIKEIFNDGYLFNNKEISLNTKYYSNIFNNKIKLTHKDYTKKPPTPSGDPHDCPDLPTVSNEFKIIFTQHKQLKFQYFNYKILNKMKDLCLNYFTYFDFYSHSEIDNGDKNFYHNNTKNIDKIFENLKNSGSTDVLATKIDNKKIIKENYNKTIYNEINNNFEDSSKDWYNITKLVNGGEQNIKIKSNIIDSTIIFEDLIKEYYEDILILQAKVIVKLTDSNPHFFEKNNIKKITLKTDLQKLIAEIQNLYFNKNLDNYKKLQEKITEIHILFNKIMDSLNAKIKILKQKTGIFIKRDILNYGASTSTSTSALSFTENKEVGGKYNFITNTPLNRGIIEKLLRCEYWNIEDFVDGIKECLLDLISLVPMPLSGDYVNSSLTQRNNLFIATSLLGFMNLKNIESSLRYNIYTDVKLNCFKALHEFKSKQFKSDPKYNYFGDANAKGLEFYKSSDNLFKNYFRKINIKDDVNSTILDEKNKELDLDLDKLDLKVYGKDKHKMKNFLKIRENGDGKHDYHIAKNITNLKFNSFYTHPLANNNSKRNEESKISEYGTNGKLIEDPTKYSNFSVIKSNNKNKHSLAHFIRFNLNLNNENGLSNNYIHLLDKILNISLELKETDKPSTSEDKKYKLEWERLKNFVLGKRNRKLDIKNKIISLYDNWFTVLTEFNNRNYKLFNEITTSSPIVLDTTTSANEFLKIQGTNAITQDDFKKYTQLLLELFNNTLNIEKIREYSEKFLKECLFPYLLFYNLINDSQQHIPLHKGYSVIKSAHPKQQDFIEFFYGYLDCFNNKHNIDLISEITTILDTSNPSNPSNPYIDDYNTLKSIRDLLGQPQPLQSANNNYAIQRSYLNPEFYNIVSKFIGHFITKLDLNNIKFEHQQLIGVGNNIFYGSNIFSCARQILELISKKNFSMNKDKLMSESFKSLDLQKHFGEFSSRYSEIFNNPPIQGQTILAGGSISQSRTKKYKSSASAKLSLIIKQYNQHSKKNLYQMDAKCNCIKNHKNKKTKKIIDF